MFKFDFDPSSKGRRRKSPKSSIPFFLSTQQNSETEKKKERKINKPPLNASRITHPITSRYFELVIAINS